MWITLLLFIFRVANQCLKKRKTFHFSIYFPLLDWAKGPKPVWHPMRRSKKRDILCVNLVEPGGEGDKAVYQCSAQREYLPKPRGTWKLASCACAVVLAVSFWLGKDSNMVWLSSIISPTEWYTVQTAPCDQWVSFMGFLKRWIRKHFVPHEKCPDCFMCEKCSQHTCTKRDLLFQECLILSKRWSKLCLLNRQIFS